MSLEEPPVILLRWCKDRSGIRLKKDYLRLWKAAKSQPIVDYEAAYSELVADFLKTDISTTSEPVIQDEFAQNPVDTFPVGHLREGCGVILQIQDTLDIRHSTFSLLNSLNNATPVRQLYIERNEGDDVNLPRGMLQWVLTDGTKQIYAMEIEAIPGLDLKTPFGCKLLIKGCRVRRGMLMLTKDNVKVLGGDVMELYGGDMIAELEDRFKRKLGIINEPITPVPTENGNIPGAHAAPTQAQNSRNPAMSAQSIMQTEQPDNFDDDINYDDLPMDSFETDTASSRAMESVGTDSNATLLNTASMGYSDDDDFMDPPPPHVSPSRPSTSINRASLTKRPQQAQETTASSKRTRVEASSPVAEVPASTTPAPPQHDQNVVEPTPMDTDEDDEDEQGDLSFVDPSVWANFEMAVNNDKIQYDEQGRANCSFDILKQILIDMREQTGGNVPDTLRVKAQCIKMAKLKMHVNQCFYLELLLGDPIVKYEKSGPLEGTIRAVVNNELMYKLMGKEVHEVKEIYAKGGQAGIANQVLKPVRKKITQIVVYLTLDMTVLEKNLDDPQHALMPLITNYEPATSD
ncbi:RAS2 protein [Mucor velutinosus]|uniref:RecQ-mediated genome instability protein 1 n=1 Tax=Mucor velutinosus TaxID=708070 RepID=A0AAN7DQ82_9FUNG|nr:RAS2 protein [Mucor velutinosus]